MQIKALSSQAKCKGMLCIREVVVVVVHTLDISLCTIGKLAEFDLAR